MGRLHDPADVEQKLPANVFKIHVLMLDVCWTFAGSCKHPITKRRSAPPQGVAREGLPYRDLGVANKQRDGK